jgi:hypothetical protein
MDLKETGSEGVNMIFLAEGRNQWLDIGNKLMKLGLHKVQIIC